MTSPGVSLEAMLVPAVPEAAIAVLKDHGVDAGSLVEMNKTGLRRPVTRFGSGGIVVEVAESEPGRERIRRELWGRQWAAQAGLATAVVFDADQDGSWLVGEWVEPGAPTGTGFLDHALAAAQVITDAAPPSPGPPANLWRSPRRAALTRTARAVSGRMPIRLWWEARKAATALPMAPTAHGDYYHRNVLWRPDRDEVYIVDWEYLGPAARYTDPLRLWTVLPERADRDAVLERLFRAAPVDRHRDIATLGLWLALRLLGENLKAPRRARDSDDLAHAWSIQPEAAELARSHEAWPI